MMLKYLFPVLFILVPQFLFSQKALLIESGKAKQKEGKHEAAIMDFSSVIKNDDPQIQQFLKKWDEYQMVDLDKAVKGMEAPSIDIAFSIPYYLRGVSYSAIGQNAEAMSDFTAAIKINSKSGAAYYQRGKLFLTLGKKNEGCVDLGMAGSLGDSLAKDMFDENFCWKEAVIAYKEAASKVKLNQYQAAFDLIQQSIKLCPDSGRFLSTRGNCYLGMGKDDLAFNDFDKATILSPNNADAFWGRGVVFYTKGKHQEAFEDFDRAIQLNSGFSNAYLYRAYACEGMNKNESALYDYQQVQRLKPYDALAYYKSGLLRNSMNDTKGACKDFNKAASLGSVEAAGYVNSCK